MTGNKKRIAIFLSAPVSAEQEQQVRDGKSPRHDILALRDRLGATLIQPGWKPGYGRFGSIGRYWQMSRLGWMAWRRRSEYDVIIVDLDAVGVVLAALLKLSRSKKGFVLICHAKIAFGIAGGITRRLHLNRQINYFVCYGPAVAKRLVEVVGVPQEQVKLVRHAADHHWWKPSDVPVEKMISSAGLLMRDYPSLAEAVRGLDVQVQVAAYSPWVDPVDQPGGGTPDNMTFTRLPQHQLKDLYARSAFVVVPGLQSDDQSGSLVIYEAMAMGKAVIAASTRGQIALGLVRDGETGIFYEPGDVEALRAAIVRLLENPDEAARMGAEARKTVEREMNMDTYLDEMVGFVESVAHGD